MKQYIDKAKETINFNSPAMLEGNKFYQRNRIIDLACSFYCNDSANFHMLYDEHRPDIIEDEDRARHYGQPIGTQIGWCNFTTTNKFFDHMARVKWLMKKEMRGYDD